MFDIAPSEMLLVAVVALLVIGPKDLPLALRSAGRWMGKVRRMSNHFRAGVETMIREAELAEIEKEWRERNARIMAEHPDAEALEPRPSSSPGYTMEPLAGPAAVDGAVDAAAEPVTDTVSTAAAAAEAREGTSAPVTPTNGAADAAPAETGKTTAS